MTEPAGILPGEPVFDAMARLYRYWSDLPDSKPRQSIDPAVLGAKLLPHVSLGHYIEGGADYRHDLVGHELKIIAPRLVPGALSSDVLPLQGPQYDLVHDTFCSTGKSQRPRVMELQFRSMEDMSRKVLVIFLPLGIAESQSCAEDLMFGQWRLEPDQNLKKDSHRDLTDWFFEKFEKGR